MPEDRHAGLTPAERRVLRALIDAPEPPQVAERLGIELSTVRWHVQNLHAKTDTHNVAALVLWALRHWNCCVGIRRDAAGDS